MRILWIVHINVFGMGQKGHKMNIAGKGGTPLPCLETFHGHEAFSEQVPQIYSEPPSKILSTCQLCRNLRLSNTKSQESQAVRNYVLSLKNSTVAYLAYHRWNLLKKFANIFCVFPVSFTIYHNDSKMQKNWTYNIDTIFAQFWWENHLPLVTYRWKGKIHLTLGHMQM